MTSRGPLLRALFDAAVAAAQPALCLPPHLPRPPKGRTIVIGAGKASAAMARALEDHWDGPLEGIVVTRYGYDVPGDNPIDIASGPTVADPTTCADALAIVDRYRIAMPPTVRALLESGRGETVKPGDPRLAGIQTRMIAAPQIALEAAAKVARDAGLTPYILGDSLEGEARDIGKALAGITRQVCLHGQPFTPPCVLLSGGETAVTLKGSGRGGRNVEFLLSLAVALDGLPGVHAIAGDTDGVDGAEEIAGACISPDTLARAWALGINPRTSLDNNDGHGFFQALGDSVVTGPTLTNVNDFRAIVIDGPSASAC